MSVYKHKRTSTPGRVPSSSQLQEGEIALNIADKKIFTKSGSEIIELSGGGSSSGGLKFKKIYTCGARSVAGISFDGKLYMWGPNEYNCMGQGVGAMGQAGVVGGAGFSGFVMVNLPYKTFELIDYHQASIATYAVMRKRSDGKLYIWSWGYNGYGQLGHGNTTTGHAPKKINLRGMDITQWVFPDNGTYAHGGMIYLKLSDGKWYGFGRNIYGRLGNGDGGVKSIPTEIGYPSGYTYHHVDKLWNIGHDYGRTFIKMNDNTLWVCGYNGQGQLGDGTGTSRSSWTKVLLPSSDVLSLRRITGSAGYHNASGESANGETFFMFKTRSDDDRHTVYSCGSGSYYANGTQHNVTTPAQIAINVFDLYNGTNAGMYFATVGGFASTTKSVLSWGADQQAIWGDRGGEISGGLDNAELRKGRDTDPNITYATSGWYRAFNRFPLFWWPDGHYWYPTTNAYGVAGKGNITKVDINSITVATVAKYRIPLQEGEQIIQMELKDFYAHPIVYVLTDKGTLYAAGYASDNYQPNLFNKYLDNDMSTWRKLT